MPDPVVPPQAAPEQTGTPTEAQTSADERYEKLEQMFHGLQKQMNGISAAQRVKAKEPASVEPTPEQSVTLKSLKAELDARDAKIKGRAINTEIDSWVKSQGIEASAAPFVKAYIREQFGSKLTVNEQDEVIYLDEFNEAKSFAELGQKILSGPGGQNLKPPVSTPGSAGQRSSANGVNNPAAIGTKPIDKWSPEDWRKNQAQGLALLRDGMRRQQGL